jgi:N-glycosylase/DNA lyase
MGFAEIPAPDFDLDMTLNSGQVFHWEKIGRGFVGTIGEQAVYVEQDGKVLKVRCAETAQPARETRALPKAVAHYFGLDHPLAEICDSFPDDPIMNAARSYCRGLRIIRQPKWECLATFICSSMKQVAHIRQISRKLRERLGERRMINLQRLQNTHGGSAPNAFGSDAQVNSASTTILNIEQGTARSTDHSVFTFPAAERIAASTEKELRECALGYRAKNLLATARMVAGRHADLEGWSGLSDVDLRAKLCGLPGVGAKIANCVMLFAYERLRAFPIDVWIERVLREKYFAKRRNVTTGRLRKFAETYFGEHGGYAQQYLFHHARTMSRKSGRVRDSSTPLRSARNDKKKARVGLQRGGRRAVGALNETDTTARVPPSEKRSTGKVLNTRAKAVSKIDRVKRAQFVTISPVT